MERKRKRPTSIQQGKQRCRCGWVGTKNQLAILVRKDTVVSKICPSCGTSVASLRLVKTKPSLGVSRVLH